jgi:hypothetical protein
MDAQTSKAIEQDRILIDRITYLASLTSESKVIDPMLDPLRQITARWDRQAPLEKADRMHLIALQRQLKDFLITEDPLRSFTAEDLEDRIRLRETKESRFNTYIIACVASFVFAGLVYLIPDRHLNLQYKTLIAACLQMLIAQIITVWFYMSNLNNFKQEFRRAFVYISFGILPLGVFFAQIGLVQVLGIGDATPFQYADMSYLATLAFVIMYIGFRKYALLLNIKNKASSLVTVVLLSVVAVLVAIFVPHPSKPHSLLFFSISVASIMLIVLLAIINAILINKIMRTVTSAYRRPLRTVSIYMYASMFGAAVADAALYMLGELSAGNLTIVILVAAIPQQLLLLYSGYQFQKYIGR